MSELSEHVLDGLLQAEEASGATLSWAGQKYPCTGGAEFGGKQLDLGGFKLKAEVTVVVRTAVFPAGVGLPQEKQTLLYSSAPGLPGRKLRIDSVTPWQGAMLVLECNDPNRGA